MNHDTRRGVACTVGDGAAHGSPGGARRDASQRQVAVQANLSQRVERAAISGKGIETREDEDRIVVAWAAKVSSSGPGGADYQYLYRALEVELDPDNAQPPASA